MRILVVEDGRKVASFVLYLGGRSGKNRSLPRSFYSGERDHREGMFRQEGLYPVYALSSKNKQLHRLVKEHRPRDSYGGMQH